SGHKRSLANTPPGSGTRLRLALPSPSFGEMASHDLSLKSDVADFSICIYRIAEHRSAGKPTNVPHPSAGY
ncbi:MAG: hypothetical protein AAFW98_12395, partial [Pseudomonadota bacterium]